MSQNVCINIEYSGRDVKNAILNVQNKVNHIWVGFPLVFMFILGPVLVGVTKGFDTYTKGLTIVLIGAFFVYSGYYYLIPINRYNEFYKKIHKWTFIFSNDSVESIRDSVQSKVSWSVLKKVCEFDNSFILIDENKFLIIIPKRFFNNKTDEETVARLLKDNVKYYKKV